MNLTFNDTSVTDVEKSVTKPEFPRQLLGRPQKWSKFNWQWKEINVNEMLLKPLNLEENQYDGEEYKIAVETEVEDKQNTELYFAP